MKTIDCENRINNNELLNSSLKSGTPLERNLAISAYYKCLKCRLFEILEQLLLSLNQST